MHTPVPGAESECFEALMRASADFANMVLLRTTELTGPTLATAAGVAYSVNVQLTPVLRAAVIQQAPGAEPKVLAMWGRPAA
jgi:hypothetical protein